ncbi:MAG: DNA damage-inducible protein D [Alistipes sp.]|nr:DNA damage-inducible protein D [Candidatus Alistipes equi]
MKAEEIKNLFIKFESLACEYEGIECWSARELCPLLGYTLWQNFSKVIDKAKVSCQSAEQECFNHFIDVNKMVNLGSGSEREIQDYMLTRYACYLIAQNGDPRKPEIAFAQSYFAVQTRVAELVEKRIKEFERVQARHKLAETEKNFSKVAYEHGVDSNGFAVIRNRGDFALFHMDTLALKRKFGGKDKRALADFLPTISIKAKDFAAEITTVNVEQKNLYGVPSITKEHVDNNAAVRDILIKRGIVPESLSPAEDVQKVERRLNSEESKILPLKRKTQKKQK